MTLPLPRLDDRRWADLVEEERSLLPLYAPAWTDHNLHDPGITLLELFAWVAEQDLYRLDQVPEAHRRKFLALLGVTPRPPAGAEVAVGFRLATGGPAPDEPLELPAGLVLDAADASGALVRYLTVEQVTAVPSSLAALQAGSRGSLQDLTPGWRRGQVIGAFGDDPTVGDALYLGFSQPPPAGVPLALHFEIEGGGAEERLRLETRRREAHCPPPRSECCCEGAACSCGGDDHGGEEECTCGGGGHDHDGPDDETHAAPFVHPSVRLVWEVALASGHWRALDPAAGEVEDGTRSLTLSGRVVLRLPVAPAALRFGEVEAELPYVRCRIAGGAFDAAPRLAAVVLNGARARQEVPVGPLTLPLAPGAEVVGPAPVPGTPLRFEATFDDEGKIKRLETGVAPAGRDRRPELFVLAWAPGSALTVEAVHVGRGTGRPGQALDLPELLPAGLGMTVVSVEEEQEQEDEHRVRSWRRRADLDSSRRADSHFVVAPRPEDRSEGAPPARLAFGDGERGRVLPEGAPLLAAYRATRGRAGAVRAGAFADLADTARNRALLADFEAARERVAAIEQPLPSAGGSDGEETDDAARRALAAVAGLDRGEGSERAVTLADYERLALATPGARVARSEARAGLHPAFPCYPAPGVVTVLVLPFLPTGRPMPSRGLLASVAAYLGGRRVLGTRVEVAGPTYVEVSVRARVRALPGVDPTALARRLAAALDAFFDPLAGGPDGTGWPFGRTVYAAEVHEVLDGTQGSDHVLTLELVGADGRPRCDNLCLPPTGLVAAGAHQIQVEGGASPC